MAIAVEELEDGGWQVVHANTVPQPDRPAYMLAIHPQKREAVLAVRGTSSLADVLTDLTVRPENLETNPFRTRGVTSGIVHGGMQRAANWLVRENADLIKMYTEDKGYALTVTGHSLGAGTAVLAAMQLRQSESMANVIMSVVGPWTRVRCYAFATPAVVSLGLADSSWARSFIHSVVHDDDVVPRTSTHSMAALHNTVARHDWRPHAKRELMRALDCDDTSLVYKEMCTRFLDPAKSPIGIRSVAMPMEQQLYVPGTIVHVYRGPSGYVAAMIPATDLGEVKLSSTLLEDHLADSYIACLDSL